MSRENLKSKIFDNSRLKPLICHKFCQSRRIVPRGRTRKTFVQITLSSNKDDYYRVGVLIVLILKTKENWIMDLGCSCHICPKGEHFETLKILGD